MAAGCEENSVLTSLVRKASLVLRYCFDFGSMHFFAAVTDVYVSMKSMKLTTFLLTTASDGR